MSIDNSTASRFEAKRLLEQFGCTVAVENADGAAVLRCRFEERFNGAYRSVRFRVDFTTQLSASASPRLDARKQYACCVTLTLEKGSATAFKSACNSLRKTWE